MVEGTIPMLLINTLLKRGKVKSRLAKLAEAERVIQHHASGLNMLILLKSNVTLTTLLWVN